LDEFRTELLRDDVSKDQQLFLSQFSLRSNPKQRANIPNGPSLSYQTYLHEMHRSRFVLAPDGDRPECFRHFEALGLGTVPITQLVAEKVPHLAASGVVFDNQDWNTTSNIAFQKNHGRVNRRLIFEAYWMSYVASKVGHEEVQWWDRSRNVSATLAQLLGWWKEAQI
jgi:hypothetical protein